MSDLQAAMQDFRRLKPMLVAGALGARERAVKAELDPLAVRVFMAGWIEGYLQSFVVTLPMHSYNPTPPDFAALSMVGAEALVEAVSVATAHERN